MNGENEEVLSIIKKENNAYYVLRSDKKISGILLESIDVVTFSLDRQSESYRLTTLIYFEEIASSLIGKAQRAVSQQILTERQWGLKGKGVK